MRHRFQIFIALVLLLCGAGFPVSAQSDVARTLPSWLSSLRIWGDPTHQLNSANTPPVNNAPQIQLPEYIYYARTSPNFGNQNIRNAYKDLRVTDNPLYHGAAYLILDADIRAYPGTKLWVSMITEHRNASFGVYNRNESVVIPQFNAAIDTSISLFGEQFRMNFSAGHERNIRRHEGLMFYNMDVQGSDIFFQWKKLRVGYHKIADLTAGIGLNIDDVDEVGISLIGVDATEGWKADVQASTMTYGSIPRLPISTQTISGALYNDNLRAYAQVGSTSQSGINSAGYAYVAGVSVKHSEQWWSVDGCMEYRSYGRWFNSNFFSSNLYGVNRFRFIYPLMMFQRPFSQWAVFTEYAGQDVDCFTLRANISVKPHAMLKVFALIDYNLVSASYSQRFFYNFFSAGFAVAPVAAMSAEIALTNRGMDVNAHYPGALYLYNGVVVQAALRFSIELR